MTPRDRAAIRRRRIANPLAQPDAQEALLAVNYDFGVRIVVPDNTLDVMREVARTAQEVLALTAAIEPRAVEDIQAVAVLAGLLPFEVSDCERAVDRLRSLEVALARGTVPCWVTVAPAHNGWLLLVARLKDAVDDLSALRKRVHDFHRHVRRRAALLKPGCARPDVKLRAGSKGGKRQAADRAFAGDVALRLREAVPPWTPAELAALFTALGFERLANVEAVKMLIRQSEKHPPRWRPDIYTPPIPPRKGG